MSTPFLRDRPCNFAHVFYMPIPRPDLRGFYLFFLFAEYIFSKEVQISQIILTDEKSCEKKTKASGQVFVRAQKTKNFAV